MQVDSDLQKHQETLNRLKASAPADLQQFFTAFQDLYDRKLYHQLTLKIKQFITKPQAKHLLIPLFNEFISKWRRKMNQFSLVQIAIVCAKEFSPKDAPEALRFMAEVAKDVEAEDLESFVLAKSECAHYHLLLGQAGEAEEILSQCQRHLDSFSYSVDQVTFASYYRHCSDLYKAKADYKSYYKNSLMFLSCVSIDELSQQEKEQRAYDLSIAALLSPLYNFGELLLHPILDSLLKTRNEWIRTLLVQFNEGKVKGLEFSVLKNDQLLVQNTEFLKQKLCIMCLIELIFQKSAETKNIKFEEIAKDTGVGFNDVEVLVMKALSVGVIKGRIDQVSQVVVVEWVQPRVLNKSQVQDVLKNVVAWKERVQRAVDDIVSVA